jgi:hypothetical protein
VTQIVNNLIGIETEPPIDTSEINQHKIATYEANHWLDSLALSNHSRQNKNTHHDLTLKGGYRVERYKVGF